MSTIFYRFGASRDESRVTFDGTHISVFDVKREVILANKMGNGKDFDIGLYDNVTGEEFKDDNHQIPRSSSLIIKRGPAKSKGAGNAQNYIIGTTAADALTGDHRIEAHAKEAMRDKLNKGARGSGGTFGSLSKRFDGKEDKDPRGESSALPISTGDAEEDARIQAMLKQSGDQWEQMQEDMSHRSHVPTRYRARGGKPNAGGHGHGSSRLEFSVAPDEEPPVGYICYRCGQKGHWIQNCPSGDDPNAPEKKRFVRVTGIPRSFLKTVDTPVDGEGSSSGAMLTADGGFVRAVPDQRLWQQQAAKSRALTGADIRDQQPLDQSLTCPLCKKLVWEAVTTPCCQTAYCEECIQSHLLEHDFECPACESKIASLDKLVVSKELREKVKGYVDGELEKSKDVEDEGGKSPKSEVDSIAPSSTANETRPNVPVNVTMNNAIANGFDPSTIPLKALQGQLAQTMMLIRNPILTPQMKIQMNLQAQMLQATIASMQFSAMQGFQSGNTGMNGMGMGMGNNMGMQGMGMMNGGGMMGMGMGMNMGGGMGYQQNLLQNQNQNQFQPQMQNQQFISGMNRGRGGGMPFRGFNNRGGRGFGRGGMQARPSPMGMGGAGFGGVKRGAEEMGMDNGSEARQQRVA